MVYTANPQPYFNRFTAAAFVAGGKYISRALRYYTMGSNPKANVAFSPRGKYYIYNYFAKRRSSFNIHPETILIEPTRSLFDNLGIRRC